jgi:hypothetical protein
MFAFYFLIACGNSCSYNSCFYNICSYNSCFYNICSYNICSYNSCFYNSWFYNICSYNSCSYNICSYNSCSYNRSICFISLFYFGYRKCLLLIRLSPSFGYGLNILLLLGFGLTMFMAGLGANFEYDLKKIIGLSTLRQLDLIIITI